MRYSDEQLLRLVGEERKRSIGFGEGESGELVAARERALNYYRGDVTQDIPDPEKRSRAVDLAVAEAVDTALPDIIEVLVAGDDIATFQPNDEMDEDQARQEGEFVRHVIMAENEGFLTFYTAIKDALLVKTGLFHWWWEEEEKEQPIPLPEGADPQMLQAVAAQSGAPIEVEQEEDGSAAIVRKTLHGKVCVRAVPPEDFTVAPDTVTLKEATYCAMRDRPRVQDLIARGVDAEKARALSPYPAENAAIEQARDEAGEQTNNRGEGIDDLRQVEVRAHYIRLLDDDDKLKIFRIVTDAEERVLLEDPEEMDRMPFGAITPYINAHRFYGESVADKLIEIQKIKTTLLRMLLDSGYFALNQRMEVAESGMSDFTISDLLRNEPNMPIRVKTPGTVKPVSAGALNFDVFSALEHVSVMAEQRTGIVRNAQGLKPDTLHDTAKGAMALISAAQKRVRLIARVIAETGVKDLFLGVHALLRKGYTEEHVAPKAKLSKGWTQMRPSDWPERECVEVQVGLGSAGKEQDLITMQNILELQVKMAEMQGGLDGPLVDASNLYNAARALAVAANRRTPELFFSDPTQKPPQPPKPDPEMAKAQAQVQLEQAKAQADVQLQQAKHQAQAQTDQMKAQSDHELAMARMSAEMDLKRYQIDQELQLKREQLGAELQLKRELGFAQAQAAHEVGMAKVSAATSQVEPGGEPG